MNQLLLLRNNLTIILILLALLPTLVLAQSGVYVVQGELDSTLPKTKAYILTPSQTGYILDSAIVTNGRFLFKGEVAFPLIATLLLAKPGRPYAIHLPIPSQRIQFYLEPGIIRINSSDSLDHAVLSGTPLNVDYERLHRLIRPITAQQEAIAREWRAASTTKRQDKKYQSSIDKRSVSAEEAKQNLIRQYIEHTPNSLVSLYALEEYSGSDIKNLAECSRLFESLSTPIRQSSRGQQFAERLIQARRLEIGALAPDFTQLDSNGKSIKLSDFRGKYVLIDFWASWCGPCRRENPALLAIYKRYKHQNFTVLGVSLDKSTGRKDWLQAIASDNIYWPQVSDLKGWQNEVAQLYAIKDIPQNILISPKGRIIAKNVPVDEIDKKLAVMLFEKNSQ